MQVKAGFCEVVLISADECSIMQCLQANAGLYPVMQPFTCLDHVPVIV